MQFDAACLMVDGMAGKDSNPLTAMKAESNHMTDHDIANCKDHTHRLNIPCKLFSNSLLLSLQSSQ